MTLTEEESVTHLSICLVKLTEKKPIMHLSVYLVKPTREKLIIRLVIGFVKLTEGSFNSTALTIYNDTSKRWFHKICAADCLTISGKCSFNFFPDASHTMVQQESSPFLLRQPLVDDKHYVIPGRVAHWCAALTH